MSCIARLFSWPTVWLMGNFGGRARYGEDPGGNISKTLGVAVDLTPVLPGGTNGGLKPAIFSVFGELRKIYPGRFRFVFLSSTAGYKEVEELRGREDLNLCVVRRGPSTGLKERHVRVKSAIEKIFLLKRLGVKVWYCPFGNIGQAPTGFPAVALAADLLHRDYPASISENEREWREIDCQQLAGRADLIQVISRFTADQLHQHYGIDQSKMFLTHLAPIVPVVSVGPVERRTRYFFYPANFWVHKNHECLFIAYYQYLRSAGASAWDLYLTGSPGPRMKQLQQVAASLGLKDRVKFGGYLRDESFGQMFTNASALVFPSLYEGFGIPLTEAMTLGIPIIASNSGSIPEVCGEACHSIDARKPADISAALLKVASDEAYRKKLIGAAAQRVKNFSLESAASRLGEKLIEAAEKKSGWIGYATRSAATLRGVSLTAKSGIVRRLRTAKKILSGD